MPPPQSAGSPIPANQRYSQLQLQALLQKARQYMVNSGSQHIECEWFCREKFRAYFDEIQSEHNGVMKMYRKDNHGDPRNPINGRIDGLFFNPSVDYCSRKPPTDSIYGDTRIKIKAGKLYERAPNLYFSDFYCVSDKHRPHYIQLVMTRPGSDADQFCRTNLIAMSSTDNSDNPFFFQRELDFEPTFSVACSPGKSFWVELFFTDDVDLSTEGAPCHVHYFGHRFGGSVGLRKNLNCPTCTI